jgi:hypothetical protein
LKLGGHLCVEVARGSGAVLGEGDANGASVAGNRRPFHQPAAFGAVHQSGDGCFLDVEYAGQLGHPPGRFGEDAQQPALERGQLVVLRDMREGGLHQAG